MSQTTAAHPDAVDRAIDALARVDVVPPVGTPVRLAGGYSPVRPVVAALPHAGFAPGLAAFASPVLLFAAGSFPTRRASAVHDIRSTSARRSAKLARHGSGDLP